VEKALNSWISDIVCNAIGAEVAVVFQVSHFCLLQTVSAHSRCASTDRATNVLGENASTNGIATRYLHKRTFLFAHLTE
jgi:hypothetical protein